MDENTGMSKLDKFPQDDKEMGSFEEACGPEVLKHKNWNKELRDEERYELIAKVLDGKSIKSVAFSLAIDNGMLSQCAYKHKTNR